MHEIETILQANELKNKNKARLYSYFSAAIINLAGKKLKHNLNSDELYNPLFPKKIPVKRDENYYYKNFPGLEARVKKQKERRKLNGNNS